ncbi:TlpA family protein disulfide reductase [Sphingobacterium faecale]|uniref:Thioredoxin domain-containing protein n=1 Tax=Sphingobacterium faecale TaxID=2803775 RepID=A0ABS1R8D2_9SPHI|nr:hypothetical protein [Sphingobacterium faecale]MBL1410971.1 hypothetical protein [Sphingobacterium faecale]
MNILLKAGRGLPFGKGEQVNMLTSYQDLSSRPIELDKYVLACARFLRYGRNDGRKICNNLLMVFCVLLTGLLVSPAFGQEADGLKEFPTKVGAIVKTKKKESPIEFLQNSIRRRSYNEDPDKILKRFPAADLDKYPSVFYDIDGDPIDLLDEGEVIPDYILDMPLWVVNYPDALTDVITLRQLAGKGFLLLEFWNSHCKPCLESVIRWEESQSSLEGDVHFLGIALDQPYRVPLEIEKRNWISTHVIGRSALALSKFFFNRFSMGPLVWIQDGKLFGISQGVPKDPQLFKDILSGRVAALPAEITFKRD